MANPRGGFDRSIPDFQLRNDDGGTLKNSARIGNHCRINRIICGSRNCDQVFASHAIDEDKRDPARSVPDTLKTIDIDSLLEKPISCRGPESVSPISSQKRDMPP